MINIIELDIFGRKKKIIFFCRSCAYDNTVPENDNKYCSSPEYALFKYDLEITKIVRATVLLSYHTKVKT